MGLWVVERPVVWHAYKKISQFKCVQLKLVQWAAACTVDRMVAFDTDEMFSCYDFYDSQVGG